METSAGALGARDVPSLFRDSENWRINPAVDEGTMHVFETRFILDSRNALLNPWAGWYLDARYEHGHRKPPRRRSLTTNSSRWRRAQRPARPVFVRKRVPRRKEIQSNLAKDSAQSASWFSAAGCTAIHFRSSGVFPSAASARFPDLISAAPASAPMSDSAPPKQRSSRAGPPSASEWRSASLSTATSCTPT